MQQNELTLVNLLILLVLIAAFFVVLWLVNRFVISRRQETAQINSFSRQLVMVVVTFLGVLLIIWLYPAIDKNIKGDLFKFLGVVLSIIITLSSTTFVSNAMAGLMLRAVRNFSTGDFVRVGDQFGRITERGLFHTEIQTEDRDLTTLPNLYLVSQPVKVVRASGTIISATLSLGYDVPHGRIESLLIKAAEKTDLQEPFVYILELGDYSITYRVAGFLQEVKHLLSVRSKLRGNVIDVLHEENIEIVSPSFMNQRRLADDSLVVPTEMPVEEAVESPDQEKLPEEIIFDKANLAEKKEELKERHDSLQQEIKELKQQLESSPEEAAKEALSRDIARRERLLQLIAEKMASIKPDEE